MKYRIDGNDKPLLLFFSILQIAIFSISRKRKYAKTFSSQFTYFILRGMTNTIVNILISILTDCQKSDPTYHANIILWFFFFISIF